MCGEADFCCANRGDESAANEKKIKAGIIRTLSKLRTAVPFFMLLSRIGFLNLLDTANSPFV